jgi:peptidylprolyl isomerase
MSQQVASGNKIKVHYTGKLTDGTVFDSSRGREPLEFTAGAGQMIKGFDDGVIGMSVGEIRTLLIPSDEAYGPVQEELLIPFPLSQFPPNMNPEIGMELTLTTQDGRPVPVVVAEIEAEVAILDANHPLAGKDLQFEVELVEILGGSKIILFD